MYSLCYTFRIFCVLLASATIVRADTFLGVDESRIERLIDLGYNMDPSLDQELQKLRAEYPNSIVPDMLKIGKMYWHQEYVAINLDMRERFQEEIKALTKKAEDFQKANKEDPDAEFALALIQLLHAKHYIDHGRMFAGFMRQRAPMKTMKRLLKRYPDYHDAKMGLGMANCYLSEAPGFLKPLAILMNYNADMETGLRYLGDAKSKGLFTKVDSAYYLSSVQVDLLDNADVARKELGALVKRYPNNPRFQTYMAGLERRLKMYKAANDRMLAFVKNPVLNDFPHLRLHVLNHLVWSGNESNRFAVALDAANQMIPLLVAEGGEIGWLPWVLNAKGVALQGLGRIDDSYAVFETVTKENQSAYDFARTKMTEFDALRAKN